jgi:hydrogenase maturation protease
VSETVLVIGYGNELRRDDGAGPRVARAVAALGRPGVRALAVHQLTPELAEPLSAADRAVFVDASTGGGRMRVEPVAVTLAPAAAGHVAGPGWLLGLAEAAFGRRPAAWLVTVPADDLGFGQGLSRAAVRAVRDALAEVLRLAGSRPGPGKSASGGSSALRARACGT